MPSLPKTYDPQSVEQPTYQRWLKSGYFNPDKLPNSKKRKPFSIAMPPPNVTGELHLGHALDLTTQDILIRWKRMSGLAALWVPGTDHAGIATQILVERTLREQGISRYEIGRETFLKHVWQWKEKYGTKIVQQIEQLGASCDWSRERFTMDPQLSAAVQAAFMKLYDDGLIYRGERVIHWCNDDQTGISDLEVEYRDEPGTLWYIRYPVFGSREHITVATTRPETMLGDTGVAVHPKDERYQKLIGQRVKLPISGRVVPIVADAAVDREFGTGAVKVTPGHDLLDFEIGERHQLSKLSVIDHTGRMTAAAGRDFAGTATLEARELVIQLLRDGNSIEKTENINHNVAYCSRSGTRIEPLLSKQWFVKTKPLAKLALAALRSKKTVVVPERFTKVLVRWLENIRDWNISRQLWWGHRLPIWYCIACDTPVASIKEPKTKCRRCGDRAYKQDEDTLDTWFSSGLWTFSTLGWPASVKTSAGRPKKTSDLKRFHPTSVLGTGWDILFFWVARMLMLSTYLVKKVPFQTVYLHGLVLNEQGKKISKSKGTGVDPMPMSAKYGTDALRLSLVVGTAPGLDFRMSEAKIAGQRNFCNKLWNISRYLLSQSSPPRIGGDTAKPRGGTTLADGWILARLNEVTSQVTQHLEKYQFGLAVETLQQFIWKDYADWYVEIHKVEQNTAVLRHVLRQSLMLLHPFAPFITETIWAALGEKNLLMIEPWPKAVRLKGLRQNAFGEFADFQRLVIGLRNIKIHGAGNQTLEVQPMAKLDQALLTKLTGVQFTARTSTDNVRITLADEQLMVHKAVADAYAAWHQKERRQLELHIQQKRTLASNDKAPAHVREQATTDLHAAEERLAEL
ncbi:MAG: valine--tRNA ligase [Candidatus Kerfeldbacteria bacterium]|nr:valine--tRNA ligase [Candidatus Kerfeldbacteria bacterium]